MSRPLSHLLALLAALLGSVVPTLAVVADPAAAAAPRPVSRTATLTTSTTEVDLGETVRFAGRVTRTPRGGLVRIQQHRAGRWRTIAATRTVGTSGAYARRVAVSGDGYTRFRVVAPRSGRLRTAVSRVRLVDVVDPVEPGWVTRDVRAANTSDLSGDGRFLVYATTRSLVEDDVDDTYDVYLRDLEQGGVTLVSRGPAGSSSPGAHRDPVVSADGRFVAFVAADGLVPGDDNGVVDVVRWDREDGSTRLVSVAGGTASDAFATQPSISADGRWVAFVSAASTLVTAADHQGLDQVYLRDLNRDDAAGLQLISRRPASALTYAGRSAGSPSVASSGSVVSVAFTSAAGILASVDDGAVPQVWVWRRDGIATYSLASRTTAGQPAGAPAVEPVLSADTSTVAFTSAATDLVPGQVDTNGVPDVFVRRVLGPPAQHVTRLVSGAAASASTTADRSSSTPDLSADGSVVVFVSSAVDLFPSRTLGNGRAQVVHRDLDGTPLLVSRHLRRGVARLGGGPATVSDDGERVAFHSASADLVSTPPTVESVDGDVYGWRLPTFL